MSSGRVGSELGLTNLRMIGTAIVPAVKRFHLLKPVSIRPLAILQDGVQSNDGGEQERGSHAAQVEHVPAKVAGDVFTANVRPV